MKDLKAFLEEVAKNEALAERMNGTKDVSEMVQIATDEGFEVTEEEMTEFLMEAVSGGKGFDWRQAGLDLARDTLNSAGDALNFMSQGASAGDAFTAAGIGLAGKTVKNVMGKLG